MKLQQRRSFLLLLALLVLIAAVWSFIGITNPPQETLDQRVNDVAEQLACPVCQNESVAASSAAVSAQIRQVIRQQLQSGKSEQQVLDYFAAHYGRQILLTPPAQGINLLAWLVPLVMLLAGCGLICFIAYDWHRQGSLQREEGQSIGDVLDEDEFAQLRAQLERELMDEDPLFGSPGIRIH
jgi:cytochrome c-type biogenesis protein CcmH